ncbi:MAG: hypothetical protein WBM40_14530, partial [Thiohalocapsa sp.]
MIGFARLGALVKSMPYTIIGSGLVEHAIPLELETTAIRESRLPLRRPATEDAIGQTKKKGCRKTALFSSYLERETRLELATPTLAR